MRKFWTRFRQMFCQHHWSCRGDYLCEGIHICLKCGLTGWAFHE